MASTVMGRIRVVLGLDTTSFSQGMKRIGKKLGRFGKDMSLKLTVPIALFGAATLKAAGDFEAGMNRVEAVSGATGEELIKLRDLAKDLGATTQFSAGEAAEGMAFLAQAGFKANQIIGAMPGTLELAAAAQIDLGQAADIVSNVLSGFALKVEDLSRVNDVLVKTFTSTNTNLQQLGQAMKFAGPVAAAAGVKFEEAAAAIGLMGNAGIQASMAGTSLRGAIARLLNPTSGISTAMEEAGLNFTDATGKLIPLNKIIEQLGPHASDAGLFMKIFGLRAGPALAALVSQGSEALVKLTGELKNSVGTSARIAAAQMKGFSGAMKELKSATEALLIAIADSGLLKWATDLAKRAATLFREFSKANPELLKWGVIIGGFVAIIGPIVIAIGAMTAAIAALLPILASVGGVMALVAAGSAGVVAAFAVWEEEVTAAVRRTVQFIREWLVNKFSAIVNAVKNKIEKITGFFKEMFDKVVGNSYVPDMVAKIKDEFKSLDGGMVAPSLEATDAVTQGFQDMGQRVSSIITNMVKTGEFKLSSFKDFAISKLSQISDSLLNSAIGGFGNGKSGSGSGLLGAIGGIFAGSFSHGGQFTVGGQSGIDNNLISLKASRGERVTVETPGQQRGGGSPISVSLNFSTGIIPTVRAEVMTMLPGIVEAVKGAVVDAQERNQLAGAF